MVVSRVDAVWVWQFGMAAQKATYGRFSDIRNDRSFTKDYLQTSGLNASLLGAKYRVSPGSGRSNLTFRWPGGSAPGFALWSVDRLHLSWPTRSGGPAPWRLTPSPSEDGPGTLPGNPSAADQTGAYRALAEYAATGLDGVLVGVKLIDETDVLHIRAYITDPPPSLSFATTALMPSSVEALTTGFTKRKACQSADFSESGTPPVYFDTDRNHDAWSTPHAATTPVRIASVTTGTGASAPNAGAAPDVGTDDSFAEAALFSQVAVDRILRKISAGDFTVPNNYSSTRTRGSAQRAFARVVKDNYGWACAVTGISTRDFLVASHIVPWSDDASIRTDPANGICLSTLVDKAFDAAYLTIDAGSVVHVDASRLADDPALLALLIPYDGASLRKPLAALPDPAYLQRRLDSAP